MNIQLFLGGQEVELNDKVSFPLNKTFDHLWNPTDIIIEYSKSVKVPATAVNNRLMANAYRIDRQFVSGESDANIGLYLDPLRRIPMQLIYNNSILLDGYAKYQSATMDGKTCYYNFNLYGVLGDVFQTLLDCVVDENKLTDEQKSEPDGGKKYVISSHWESQLINKEFVKASWDSKYTSTNTDATNPHRHIGFAPAYRGLYSDFESSSISGAENAVATTNEPKSVEAMLKEEWRWTLEHEKGYAPEAAQSRVDAIDFNMILPNGLNEHNMRQFRSYEQKPYIYFYSLMSLYQKKCKELTGYEIKLDSSWFNINNPYWTRLCYMFDYLSVKGATTDSSLPFTGYTTKLCDSEYFTSEAKYTITDEAILSKGDITIDPFTLGMQVKTTPGSYVSNPSRCVINMPYKSYIVIDAIVETGGSKQHNYFWGGVGDPTTASGPNSGYLDKWTDDEYIYMSTKTEYDSKNNKLIWNGYLTTPSFKITHKAGDPISITYDVQYVTGYYAGTSRFKWSYSYISNQDGKTYTASIPQMGSNISSNEWLTVINNEDYKFIFPNVTYNANWRNTTTCDLKNLYTKDESLFNVILQYTKMFGLIWKPDYHNKTIDLMTRKSYFNDYQVLDWTNKVDKSKGMTIEPVSFASKYVTFNYESTDGYRYSGYKNKYGVEYGEKRLTTKYNFDTKEEKLLKEKIHASSISTKSYTSIGDLIVWDTISTLPSSESEINFIDCEDNEQTSAISLNNWYFRTDNFAAKKDYTISDASEREIKDGKYFWVYDASFKDFGLSTNVLPQFSPVFPASVGNPTVGCLFNCPNDDYTKDFQMSSALGNYIYDNCWNNFINERYNANNKKLTCYVRISPSEYEQFNFKNFVVIDNQLFVVNKIVDYDVNNATTKVELIQVSDVAGYTYQKVDFPTLIYYDDIIEISPVKEAYGDSYIGYGGIKVRCYPRLDGVADITITKISGTETSTLEVYDWQADEEDIEEDDPLTPVNAGDGELVFKWSAPSFNETEQWRITITAFGESRHIPVYVSYN